MVIVKPLVKKPSGGLVKTNYRTVSNLGFISKVVEKVTLEQFMEHCNQNSLPCKYQSAYRKEHSCETSLVKLVNDILWGMENQLVTAVVILDISVAFDTVGHDLLPDVLEMWFGITDAVRKWYHNYLKPRKFRVLIEKDKSQPRQLHYLVPQGSVQGAFLFISNASTLDELVTQLILIGFVDDQSVRRTFKSCKLGYKDEIETNAIIESSMLDIKFWVDQVWLKMNKSKMEFIYFGESRQLEKCTNTINIKGEHIQWSNVTWYLGAYLGSTLSFKEHINIKCKVAMLNLPKIKAARK